MPEDWRKALATYIQAQALPAEKFGHQPRLYDLTQQIGQGHAYDDEIVYAAVYLHDLGVFTGHRPEDPVRLKAWDNTAYAMDHAPAILRDLGFPGHKVAGVVEAIRTHQPAQLPASIEATILRDADILEQLGAVGALRTICKVGRDSRFGTFTDAVVALERALESLPSQILLPLTKELAAPRIASLRDFLDAVRSEAGRNLL